MWFFILAKAQSPQRKVKGEKPPIQEPCEQSEDCQVEVSGEDCGSKLGATVTQSACLPTFMQLPLTFLCAFAPLREIRF
jgi:hypothetical protein